MSENYRAALLMMASLLFYTINDTLVKVMSDELALLQILVIRNAMTTVGVGILAYRRGDFRRGMPRRDWILCGLRALSEALAAWLYLTALVHMTLDNVIAVLQSAPLLVTLGAAIFLREPVGWRRGSAIAVGFLGVLIIIRPGTEGFNAYALMALASVVLIAARDLFTRALSRRAPDSLITFTSASGVLTFGILASLGVDWRPLTGESLLLLPLAAGAILLGYHYSITSMRLGEVSFVSPFRYSALLWAMILGALVFGTWPDLWTVVGSAVVVGSGLYTIWRETRTGRLPVQPKPRGME